MWRVNALAATVGRFACACQNSNGRQLVKYVGGIRSTSKLRRATSPRDHWPQRNIRRTLFIQTADTPNPNSKKFYPGQPVMESGGSYVFRSRGDTSVSLLASSLFRIDGVDNLMFGDEFITVSKKEEYSWDEIKPEVFASIMDFFASGAPVFRTDVSMKGDVADDDDEVVATVKELLDTRIRPVIFEDGGDVEFIKMENGIVYLKLHGACGTCPSSTATLKGGIENMLMHYVPEVEGVEQILDDGDKASEEAFEKLERDLLSRHFSK